VEIEGVIVHLLTNPGCSWMKMSFLCVWLGIASFQGPPPTSFYCLLIGENRIGWAPRLLCTSLPSWAYASISPTPTHFVNFDCSTCCNQTRARMWVRV